MKKITFLFFILSASLFAQQEYSKLNNQDLIKIINAKETEKSTLKASLEREKKEKDKILNESSSKKNKEIAELKKIIQDINKTILREIFDNKYIKNESYFKDTDLANDDNTKKFENSNVLINSIMVDELDDETLKVCKYALDFNKNYLKLFDIRKSVLSEKYNEDKYNEAISEIEKLPVLESDNNLDKTKKRITNLLKNYLENTCLLKTKLDSYKKADQSPIMKQKYTALEKDDHYKDYPYLIQVIRNIKANVTNYSKEGLQPCEEVKKAEEVKVPETLNKDNKEVKKDTKDSPVKDKTTEGKEQKK
jgi:hypothetical protein